MSDFIKWSTWDVVKWKLLNDKLGGKPHIQNFKDSWVIFNKANIQDAALANNISAELLAGVAWVEVGGDPYIIDYIAYYIRAFDWCGPKWIDDNFTITNNPVKTSFGAVSMQLRVAAETLGINYKTMTSAQQKSLVNLLDSDKENLRIVSKHLFTLLKFDFPNKSTRILDNDQIKIAGARYNRGTGMSITALRMNTSYGDFLLKNSVRIRTLLSK